jgi:hypothetical protein
MNGASNTTTRSIERAARSRRGCSVSRRATINSQHARSDDRAVRIRDRSAAGDAWVKSMIQLQTAAAAGSLAEGPQK